MKLIVGGGMGEHGRNCFLVQGARRAIMVDCGAMAEAVRPWPRIGAEQAAQTELVFLTHSHADHAGALDWLYSMGFRGTVVASGETLRQLSLENRDNCIALEALTPALAPVEWNGMEIYWGRSGHCAGSVWLRLRFCEKALLFTGDYTEDTQVYACDSIRGQRADIAVADCAYGPENRPYADSCRELAAYAGVVRAAGRPILLPVPKYGRGLELLRLLSRTLKGECFYGDALFVQNVRRMRETEFWFRNAELDGLFVREYEGQSDGIVFVSDPQLRTQAAQKIAGELLEMNAAALMTGTLEAGSHSMRLIRAGRMDQLRYPVHLSRSQFDRLLSQNSFDRYLPFHTAACPAVSQVEF